MSHHRVIVVALAWALSWWIGSRWYRPVFDAYLSARLPEAAAGGHTRKEPSLAELQRSLVLIVDVSADGPSGASVLDRRLQAQVIKKLCSLGAWAIGVDLVYEDPGDPGADAELREALRASPRIVLAARYDPIARKEVPSHFSETGATRGIAVLVADPQDGHLRKIQHYYEETGLATSHSFSLQLARWAATRPGAPPAPIRITDNALLVSREGGSLEVPLDPVGLSFIQYQGPAGTIPALSWASLLRLDPGKVSLRGKAVIVGNARLEGQDAWLVPFHRGAISRLCGAEIHAQDVLGILIQSRYRLAPGPVEGALALLGALLGVRLGAVARPVLGLLPIALALPLVWLACGNLFTRWGLLVNPFPLVCGAAGCFLATVLGQRRVPGGSFPPGAPDLQLINPAIERALGVLDEGRPAEALARLKALVPTDGSPAPDQVHWALAMTLLGLRQPTLASAHLSAMDARRIGLEDLHRLGRALEVHGAIPEALEIYLKILSRDEGFKDVAARVEDLEIKERQVPGWLRKTLGARYRDVIPIGSGGMGRVYAAWDGKTGQEVAIKVPDEAILHLKSARARFLREAQILSTLDHPNIVRIHEIHAQDPVYYTMELIRGTSLDQLVGQGPPGDPGPVLGLLTQVTQALVAIHDAGVIHRDLKPANVLVDSSGRVRLLDFGLAFLDERTRMTHTGTALGTPLYMAPEQVNGGPPEPGWDLYALGVMLFEALCGSPPFSQTQVMLKMVRDAPSLAVIRPGLAVELVSLVGSLLARDPGRRPASARAVLEILRPLGAPRQEQGP